MPATGAIARTATNIRSGGRTPVAGLLHAAFVLLFMLVAAPLAAYVPLAALAAVLVVVAINMSEFGKIRAMMRAPLGDSLVLLITLALTVLVDLTFAIEVGVVLAAILFMHRMAEVVSVQHGVSPIAEEVDDFDGYLVSRTSGLTFRTMSKYSNFAGRFSLARQACSRMFSIALGGSPAPSSCACAKCP